LVPGTGNVLALGSGWPAGGAFGATFAGSAAFAGALPLGPSGAPGALDAPGAPGGPRLTTGLIAALGGTGSLPCWISVALCATDGGNPGVAAFGEATMGTPPLRPGPPGVPGANAGGGGRLITVSIIRLL